MKPFEPTDPETQSADVLAGNISALKELLPEVVVEGKIDFDALKQLLGGEVDEREEKYGLRWHGKRQARQIALTPSTGTLRPCPEESVDWDTTQNLMIEGDNLEVLKLLQKSYSGKVKLIYIDPPYNTGKDFVYPDNFQDNIKNYLELTGQVEGGNRTSSITEASGRLHTDWLNMMYPRLKVARNLLRPDGVIFISIDDSEVANLKRLCEEVFGDECFLGCITWQKKYAPANDTMDLSASHDFILVYAKTRVTGEDGRPQAVLLREERTKDTDRAYGNPDGDPRGPWKAGDYTCNKSAEERPNLYYPIPHPSTGDVIWPKRSSVWRYSKERHERNASDGRVWWGANGANRVPAYKRFLSDVSGIVAQTIWLWNDVGHTDEAKKEVKGLFPEAPEVFQTPKPTRLIRKILTLATDDEEGDIVLDFFAGSGTTAHAVLAQNAADGGARKCVLVQLPEPLNKDNREQRAAADFCDKAGRPRNLAELTKERLRRAARKVMTENPMFSGDKGFRVFKLDSTNIRAWDPNRSDLESTLLDSVDHLKDERKEQDVLFELLLKLGLDLTVPIETKEINGHEVHSIGAGALIVCLAPKIKQDAVEELALGIATWHKTQRPAGESTVVFRDSAFPDDVAKTNLTAILQQHGFDEKNVRSL